MGTLDEQHSRILVVEGIDDFHVITHLQQKCTDNLEFKIVQKDGVDALIDSVDVEIAEAGRRAVGFVLDANDHLSTRWKAVARKLRNRDIKLPDSPNPAGTLMKGVDGYPCVGIWLMPDNIAPGALEDFVAKMLPDSDPVWPLAVDYIEKVPRSALFTSCSKARIHAWLATRQRHLMGANIGEGTLDTHGSLCRSFLTWLEHLFG